jgi:large subunit ribosomal protein L25
VSNGGMLEQLMHTLTVEGKPGQLPNEIAHDVSALELGDQLHVGDIKVPAGIIVVNDAEELIATISMPRGLEAEEAAEGEEVEGEAAEGAEGEAADESTSSGDAESSE